MSTTEELPTAGGAAKLTKEEKRLKKDKKEKRKKKSGSAEKIVDEMEHDVINEPQSSKKRKRDILPEELEIDINLPEPASKKAARKAKKAKTQPAKSGTAATSDGTPKTGQADSSASKEHEGKRSEHGVWVGNLPWTATKDSLRTFMTSNSDIKEEEITRIHMPVPKAPPRPNWTSDKPQNKGFAYVDFSTQLAMYAAIALTETKLDGRALLIKSAKNFEGRPDKPKLEKDAESGDGGKGKGKNGVAKAPSKKVFVGNLAFETSREELEEHYSHCGNVDDIHMATFEDSGKCKGYAWVTFDSIEAATAAVNGFIHKKGDDSKTRKWWLYKLLGRELRCEFAEDSTTRYQKRFGKEKTGGDGDAGFQEDADGTSHVHPQRRNRAFGKEKGFTKPRGKVDPRTIRPGAAHANAPRASAAIVESKGTKTTFD